MSVKSRCVQTVKKVENWVIIVAHAVFILYNLCTLQPSTCSPLPLLLSGQSLVLPLAEGPSVIPAHLNHREAQTLPNAWTRSCRLNGRGSKQWKAGNEGMLGVNKKHKRRKWPHLSPKRPLYRQPPRSRLDGKDKSQKLFIRQTYEPP